MIVSLIQLFRYTIYAHWRFCVNVRGRLSMYSATTGKSNFRLLNPDDTLKILLKILTAVNGAGTAAKLNLGQTWSWQCHGSVIMDTYLEKY